MEIFNDKIFIFIILIMGIQEIYSVNSEDAEQTKQLAEISNPLRNLIPNENEIGDVSRNGDLTKDTLPRVKRQSYYDPYYRRRPVPIPILIGGHGWIGGRGFGGRGFGGRGFGGRGIGGHAGGFGGRGGRG